MQIVAISNVRSRIIIAAVATVSLFGIACRRSDANANRTASAAVRDTVVVHRDTTESGGDVSSDSSRPTPATEKWLSDANVISLLSIINGRQIAAAEMEMENWHTNSIRDFAVAMAHDHADLQRQIEALSERLNIMPVRPALADQVTATFQAQVDSLAANRGGPRGALDRAFVTEQVSSHELMANYIEELAGVAERTELQTLLSSVAIRVNADLARARAMEAGLVVADSQVQVDSAAKHVSRRKRDSTPN